MMSQHVASEDDCSSAVLHLYLQMLQIVSLLLKLIFLFVGSESEMTGDAGLAWAFLKPMLDQTLVSMFFSHFFTSSVHG